MSRRARWWVPVVAAVTVATGCAERNAEPPGPVAPAAPVATESAPVDVPPVDVPPQGAPARLPPGAEHDVLPPLRGEDLPTFTTERSNADVQGGGDAAPILRDVRVGAHEGFDRVVFEFDSAGLPQWDVAYLDGPGRDCGTGEAVALAGTEVLQVRFSGAAAHTPAGQSTSAPRRRDTAQPTVRELVRTCDFEAEVTWVLGIEGRRPYRPRVLDDPARLVLDIEH